MAVALLAAPVTLRAQNTAPLGNFDVAITFGYVVFSGGVTEDDGFYLGLAGYGRVAANVYVGAEVAGASAVTLFTDEMTLLPLELNVKYARPVGSRFVLAGGGGLTYARAEFHHQGFVGPDVVYEEWLFGGQAFADFAYRIRWFELGVNAKYQLMGDFEQVPADFSNFRVGLEVGVVF